MRASAEPFGWPHKQVLGTGTSPLLPYEYYFLIVTLLDLHLIISVVVDRGLANTSLYHLRLLNSAHHAEPIEHVVLCGPPQRTAVNDPMV